MDCLEHLCHRLHLRPGYGAEHVAVEVDGAALIFRLRKHLTVILQHALTLVAYDEPYAVQSSALQPLEETLPAGFVLFHALRSARDFPITVFVYLNGFLYPFLVIQSVEIQMIRITNDVIDHSCTSFSITKPVSQDIFIITK